MAYARLPAQELEVLPAAKVQVVETPIETAVPATPISSNGNNTMLYAVIGLLGGLLLITVVCIFGLYRKINRLTEDPMKTPEKQEENKPGTHHKELQSIQTPKQLLEFLQLHAHQQWQTPRNATVSTILRSVKEISPSLESEDLLLFEKKLEDALYRNIDVDIDELKDYCSMIFKHTGKGKTERSKQEKLPKLNPS